MQLFENIALIVTTAMVHASFQLSVSLVTIMSGHSLGRKTSKKRLSRLILSFITGSSIFSMLLLVSSGALIEWYMPRSISDSIVWLVSSATMLGIGLTTWIIYYRKQPGTTLWIPRSFAKFLTNRAKSTKSSAEAFGLGMSSIFAELLFYIAPVLGSAVALQYIAEGYKLPLILLYVIIASLPQIAIFILINRGVSVSVIQRWRERNKKFLQFSAGGLLIISAIYSFVVKVYPVLISLEITNG